MTAYDVRQRVARIRGMSSDEESAHSAEDDLYADVLREIARYSQVDSEAARFCAALASEALRTKDIDFARWCA